MEYAKSRSRERPWQTNISSKARKVLSTKHVSMINHSTGSSLSKVESDARLARLIQENDELKPRASIIRTLAL